MNYHTLFFYLILVLKLYFLLFFIGLVIIQCSSPIMLNYVNQFPKEETFSFFLENVVVGFFSGLSIALMAYLRKKSWQRIFMYFVITFVIMVFINLLFQYSGSYLKFYSTDQHYPWPNSNIYYISIMGSLFVVLLLITIPVFLQFVKYKDVYLLNQHRWSLLVEAITFGLVFTVPSIWIAKNRHVDISKRNIVFTILTFFSLIILFFILEVSGVWYSLGLNYETGLSSSFLHK